MLIIIRNYVIQVVDAGMVVSGLRCRFAYGPDRCSSK